MNEQINFQNNNINSSVNSDNNENNLIITRLIELGFNPLYSKRIFLYYHPDNIEDAIDYLSSENGIVQHHFVQERNDIDNNICYLCGEEKNIHLNSNSNNEIIANNSSRNSEDINKIKSINIMNDSIELEKVKIQEME